MHESYDTPATSQPRFQCIESVEDVAAFQAVDNPFAQPNSAASKMLWKWILEDLEAKKTEEREGEQTR